MVRGLPGGNQGAHWQDSFLVLARDIPEVMVKISGGGQSDTAVAAHFKYIGRQEHLKGKGAEKILIEDWELELDVAESRSPHGGVSDRRPAKLVHNIIVLSMSVGTRRRRAPGLQKLTRKGF